MDLVLADEFRDGNVPAIQEPRRVAQLAFAALPETVREYYFRGDAACCEHQLLTWLRDEQRENGPPGRIGFAVSVPLHASLREEIEATAPERWRPCGEDGGAVKECAVVNYYPQEEPENRYREPLRYIGIRIRRKQHDLFDGRRRSAVLCGGGQSVGLGTETVVGVAARESGLYRSRA